MIRTDLKVGLNLESKDWTSVGISRASNPNFFPWSRDPPGLYLPYRKNKKNGTYVPGTQRMLPITAQSKVLNTSRLSLPT